MTTDQIDRDFGAVDDRTWTLPELFDEITRQTVDAIESRAPELAPLLAVLVDVARLRAQTPEPTSEGE